MVKADIRADIDIISKMQAEPTVSRAGFHRYQEGACLCVMSAVIQQKDRVVPRRISSLSESFILKGFFIVKKLYGGFYHENITKNQSVSI